MTGATCLGLIGSGWVMCGEGGNYCSEECMKTASELKALSDAHNSVDRITSTIVEAAARDAVYGRYSYQIKLDGTVDCAKLTESLTKLGFVVAIDPFRNLTLAWGV